MAAELMDTLSADTTLAALTAWDPGALAVSRVLSDRLDTPLVEAAFSRLVIDPNRALDAPDLIRTESETGPIPANQALPEDERQYRIDRFHRPYHAAIDTLLDARRHAGQESVLVCLHSFAPVHRGRARPWPVGILPGHDPGFSLALRQALADLVPGLAIGWNEPYASMRGVTLTLERHGRGLAATMIELRHDEILSPDGVALWADRLAEALMAALLARRALEA